MDTLVSNQVMVERQIATQKDTGPVQVGVIGCGYWGPKLARNFHELDSAQLVSISDMRVDRLAEMERLYPNIRVTPDCKDLFEADLDAVVIATPVHTHYKLAKEALLAGKHVLVEKPIAASSSQAWELAELARQQGLVLMVGHTFLYNPAVQTVRNVVQSGQLGKIFYLNATRANLGLLQPDINVMWDLAPHDISMLHYILDSKPTLVSARGSTYVNTSRNLPEVVYLNIVFENGVMANLRLSWLDPVKQRTLTVVGSQKMLVYDDISENKVVMYDKGVDIPDYSLTEAEFRASYRHGDEEILKVEWDEPLGVECKHFVDCIRNGKTPLSDAEDGLRVLRVLETAQRSLKNGGVELLVEY